MSHPDYDFENPLEPIDFHYDLDLLRQDIEHFVRRYNRRFREDQRHVLTQAVATLAAMESTR